MKRRKITTLMLIGCMTFSLATLPKNANAAESGVYVSNIIAKDVISSTGIGSETTYSSDKRTIYFNYDLMYRLNALFSKTAIVFEVCPTLAPYLVSVNVIGTKNTTTVPQTFGTCVIDSSKVFSKSFIGYIQHAKFAVTFSKPLDCIMQGERAMYSVKMVDLEKNGQYALRTRIQGIIEKNPTSYATVNYGMHMASFGFPKGAPLSSEDVIELQYKVEYGLRTFTNSTYEFHFDPCLVEFIDRVDVYNSKSHLAMSTALPNDGKIKVPMKSVYPSVSLFVPYTVSLKVSLKDGYRLSDLPCNAYKITALSTYAPSAGVTIHKNSVRTLAIGTRGPICVDPICNSIDDLFPPYEGDDSALQN